MSPHSSVPGNHSESSSILFPAGVRGFPSAAGPDGHLHAWEDTDTEDLSHSDIQSSSVAEDP